jgi:hypothetical protein
MSLTLEREAKTAPIIQLRPDFLAAPDAQPPMQVIRRNGTASRFDASEIPVAMTKAFLAVEGHTAAASRRVSPQRADRFDAGFSRGGEPIPMDVRGDGPEEREKFLRDPRDRISEWRCAHLGLKGRRLDQRQGEHHGNA